MPDEERAEQQGQQQTRTASVPDSERSIRKIGQRRADRGRGDDGRPVQEGVEALGLDLRYYGSQEDRRKDGRADLILSTFH